MTSLNRLIGLQAVYQGRRLGQVERGVINKSGDGLAGLIIRKGLGGARWSSIEQIEALGGVSVVLGCPPSRLPREPEIRLGPVWEPSGLRLGMVTDVYLCSRTGRVEGLEISLGPVDDWRFGRMVATEYALRREKNQWKVLTPLAALAPLTAQHWLGEEDAHESE